MSDQSRQEEANQTKQTGTKSLLGDKKCVNLVKAAVIIVIAAFAVEILVFNFRSVQSMFYKEISVPVDGHLMTGMKYFGEGVFKFTPDDVKGVNILKDGETQSELEYGTGDGVDEAGNAVHALYLTHLDELTGNADIHNIKLDVETPDSIDMPFAESGVLYVKTHIKDAGNELYEHLETHPIIQTNEASKYIFMQTSGKASAIVTEFSLSNGVLITLKGITLNAHRPVIFSFWRFLLTVFVFLSVYALRPSSVLWRMEAAEKASWKKYVLLFLCVIYIMPAWILIRDNAYLTNFVEFNPYQDLAEALSDGHLFIDEEPDPALASLSNPYDDSLREAEGVYAKWDYAYYKGRYYVYFGIIPCLIFYLPIYALLGTHMPNSIPVLCSAVFLLIGIYDLIRALALVYYPKLKYAVLLILTTLAYFGSQMPFFLNQPDGYAVPVACAEAMLVWAIYFWVSSLKAEGRKMYVRIAAGSFIMALIAGTRPNMEIYALLAVPLFVGRIKGSQDRKIAAGSVAALILPFIPVAAGLMYYNAARFGSVFDFGNNYNMTVSDVSLNPLSLDKLLIGGYEYLLKLPDLNYAFPFIAIPGDGTSVNSLGHCFMHMEYIFSGLLPVNLTLLAIPALFFRAGNKQLRYFGLTAVMAALLLLVFDSESAGIVYRYEADFSLALLIASAAALMLTMQKTDGYEGEGGIAVRKIISIFILVAIAWSLVYHFNFYFLSGLKYPLIWGNSALYYRIYYAFMFL